VDIAVGIAVGAEVLEDTLGRVLGCKVREISLGGRSIGGTLGNEVIGISLGYVNGKTLGFSVDRTLGEAVGSDDTWLGDRLADNGKTLGFSVDRTLGEAVGSDDTWLGDRLAGMLWDTLGRALGNEVFGSSLRCRRLGRSLGENVGNEVLGVSLGDIESLRYVLGSGDGIRLEDLLADGL
jgi:hypothetical protein